MIILRLLLLLTNLHLKLLSTQGTGADKLLYLALKELSNSLDRDNCAQRWTQRDDLAVE